MKKLVLLAPFLFVPFVYADKTDVTDVSVSCSSTCSFHVTLKHADSGWEHYANQWDIISPEGKILGTRVLYHPHVNEQPFTRSLSGVKIPAGINQVTIRAKDSVHGYGGKEMTVNLRNL